MSATGNPRNKVALKPGHSLMDWIRLGNSGEDLAGTGGTILQVTKDELAKHSTEKDVWICIRGNVYNITRYLDFHPGGRDELMKAAGIDGTTLFNQVHPWVNFESILRKCLVGRLTCTIDEDIFQAGPSKKELVNNILKPPPPPPLLGRPDNIKVDWYQQQDYITIVIYVKDFPYKLLLNNEDQEVFYVLYNSYCLRWSLPHPVSWPPTLIVTESKVEVKFSKENPMTWPEMPRRLENEILEPVQHWPMVIKQIERVNHNVFLIGLSSSKRVLPYVPIGYHVPVKATINGMTIERNYTAVCGLTRTLSHDISLLVKSYPDGMLSSWFTSRKIGEQVMVGNPVGNFTTKNISKSTNIILIAAGSGLTPMVRIIDWALRRRNKVEEIKLIFFNKTEKDIIWKSDLEKLQAADRRLRVEHVLSEADTLWRGANGWVTPQLLQKYIPNFCEDEAFRYFVCVCGPIAFTQLTERYLQDMCYTTSNYFCFRG